MEGSEFQIKIENKSEEIVPLLYTGNGNMNYSIPKDGIPQSLQKYAEGLVNPTKQRMADIDNNLIEVDGTEKKKLLSSYGLGIKIVATKKA